MTIRSIAVAAVATALSSTLAAGLSAQSSEAQTSPSQQRWGLRIASGVLVPTGAQRATIKQGKMTAAQISYAVRPALALTAAAGWARTRDIATAGDPKLDAFTYDVGAELRTPNAISSHSISLRPFAGLGAGGRSYNYRSLDVDATHNAAAYGSVGGELGVRRLRLRVEARDYVTGFKPLGGAGAARTGNDVVVMAGLSIVRH